MARVLRVELDGMGSLMKGHGARELIISVTGRAPMWSSVRRGWSLQETTARDIVAAAEGLGWEVVITGPGAISVAKPMAEAPKRAGVIEGGLW